ncbi:MAG: dihydrolipoyl dehydrogenase [Gemmatimonadetes bacterium]|nr:dihydrolipoyl dehydrogenase [Gemmatimonadota bacterium]|tara:strand:- start:473 stop:1870 length:1398 start_codon:yes stop_codon:yes gene_type:complete
MADDSFDVIVIGAGPGGYVAAIRGAQLGMKMACVEKSGLGGTCLNVGCIPSKALLESSQLYHQAHSTFATHGIQTGDVVLDLPAMMKRKDGIVVKMTGGIRGLFRKNKVTYLDGLGKLAGDGKVVVSDGKGEGTYSAKHIVIATGSSPVELPFLPFDGEHVVSSTEALTFDSVPERMIVIGAGAIGLELGSVWTRLGTEVLVVELLDQICAGMDKEMSGQLQKSLQKQGLSFELAAKATGAEVKDGRVHVNLEAGGEALEEVCDRLLVAVGRRPHTDGLGAEEAGVELDDRRRVAVNDRYETKVPGVYAIGDVIAGPMLAHKAEEEGVAVVELIAGRAGHVNYGTVPGVVYTHPELASVGLTEAAAREAHGDVKIGKFPFAANGRAHSLEDIEGMVKIIAHPETDRVLGVHILGGRAAEMLGEAVIAMEFSSSAEDIARTIHAHPTLPEAMKEAALAVEKEAIHI